MAQTFLVKPGDRQNFEVRYEDTGNPSFRATLEAEWKHFNRFDPATNQTFYIWYRPTNRKSQVMADYKLPVDAPLGVYRVEVFVPGKNATTRKALFTIANNFRQEDGVTRYDDTIAAVDMFDAFDEWITLGEFLLHPAENPLSGRVRQYALSLEDPAARVTFGPVRWVPLFTTESGAEEEKTPGGEEVVVTGGGPRFDFPVGTQAQRDAPIVAGRTRVGLGPLWLDDWYDANPYLVRWYALGYHTGADLNSTLASDADKDAPIYAIADGKVIFAGVSSGSWGNLIVIEHPDALVTLPNGTVQRQRIFSRYGHTTNDIRVAKGQDVKRGELLSFIGLMKGAVSGWHLHFDIGYSSVFATSPGHWPNLNKINALIAAGKKDTREYQAAQVEVKQQVMAHYIDPYKLIKDNHG